MRAPAKAKGIAATASDSRYDVIAMISFMAAICLWVVAAA